MRLHSVELKQTLELASRRKIFGGVRDEHTGFLMAHCINVQSRSQRMNPVRSPAVFGHGYWSLRPVHPASHPMCYNLHRIRVALLDLLELSTASTGFRRAPPMAWHSATIELHQSSSTFSRIEFETENLCHTSHEVLRHHALRRRVR